MSGGANPTKYRNKKHLGHVGSFGCLVAASFKALGLPDKYRCEGRLEIHHILNPWSGERGASMRAGDQNTVPLCTKHHRELHAEGNERRWAFNIFGVASYLGEQAKKLWVGSPHYEELASDNERPEEK